jgi:hypothetical protein
MIPKHFHNTFHHGFPESGMGKSTDYPIYGHIRLPSTGLSVSAAGANSYNPYFRGQDEIIRTCILH